MRSSLLLLAVAQANGIAVGSWHDLAATISGTARGAVDIVLTSDLSDYSRVIIIPTGLQASP